MLPFFNQSGEPTLDVNMVAEKYYAALQAIPGFEVLPMGVVENQLRQYAMIHGMPRSGIQFQQLARMMDVEAIVVGSVTDFQAYYPPQMAMTVHWYSANEGFHAIPAGYGLPWGTEQEKTIPRRIAREAEFELARSQLATQAPISQQSLSGSDPKVVPSTYEHPNIFLDENPVEGEWGTADLLTQREPPMPPAWPDPTNLIPDPPAPVPPPTIVSRDPVLSHTRIYQGDDPYFTGRLADYVEGGDDSRGNGWQGYLKRSDDFVHFCCHLHITEMLESRGGREQSEFIVRWPLSRY